MLRKTYFSFLFFNTTLFSLGIIISAASLVIPLLYFLVFSSIFGLTFIIHLIFSICIFIGGKKDRFNTSSGDLIILIMTFIRPFLIGFFASITGLIFCILNLVRYHRWKKDREAKKLIEELLQATV